MNCNEWQELPINEKIQMIGKVCHLIQNEGWFFEYITDHLRRAEKVGMFDEIIINPNSHDKTL